MAGTPEQHIYILRGKLNDATTALEEETREKTELKTANEQLTAEIRRQQEAYGKLEKHTKACEKATTKAQKEAKNARGHADHLINSQKGQLKSAERRYADASRCLKEWTERYGSVVEKPAEDQHALQLRLFECQSNAELARNHIVSLEEQIQGTPTQIGLHQALEEWEEHQGCSAEFANLEDKVHDGLVLKGKLESDLAASKERYQKAKADLKTLQIKTNQLQQVNKALQGFQGNANQLEQFNKEFQELQIKANQLEQTNKALQDQHDSHDYTLHIQKLESDLKASREQCQITEWDMKALEEKVTQLEQTNEDSRVQDDSDVEMLDDNTLDKAKLESEFKTLQARHQKTQSDMKALQEKADELENDKKAFQDQHESLNDMLQKLQLDQKAGQEQNQENESNRKALQEKADQLESELKSTKEQHQTTKAGMDMLQEKADQLKSNLKTAEEQYQTTKSNMEKLQGKGGQLEQVNKALQEKGDQLESDLKTTQEQYHTTKSNMDALQGKAEQLESDLKTAQEQYQTTKSNMDVLQGKVEQLEQANATLQAKENERLQIEALEKKEQYEKANNEIAESEQRDTPEETEHSQVSSSAHNMGFSSCLPDPAQNLYSC